MEEDAKTPMFLSHRATLCAVARKYLLHPEDVEDALQELFIRSWENRRTDTSPEQKRAFLFAALRLQAVRPLCYFSAGNAAFAKPDRALEHRFPGIRPYG